MLTRTPASKAGPQRAAGLGIGTARRAVELSRSHAHGPGRADRTRGGACGRSWLDSKRGAGGEAPRVHAHGPGRAARAPRGGPARPWLDSEPRGGPWNYRAVMRTGLV